jgi:hypothetical protein
MEVAGAVCADATTELVLRNAAKSTAIACLPILDPAWQSVNLSLHAVTDFLNKKGNVR